MAKLFVYSINKNGSIISIGEGEIINGRKSFVSSGGEDTTIVFSENVPARTISGTEIRVATDPILGKVAPWVGILYDFSKEQFIEVPYTGKQKSTKTAIDIEYKIKTAVQKFPPLNNNYDRLTVEWKNGNIINVIYDYKNYNANGRSFDRINRSNSVVNDKFKGLGSELYSSTPEDIADANRALANSLGQIKNIFNVTPQQLANVGATLETLKGLDQLDGQVIPAPDTIDFFKNTFANGSGQNGEYLLTDVVGTPTGWVHEDELKAEGPRLAELERIGALNNLVAEPNGFDPGNTGNGIYTVMKYHVIHDSYYTPISVIDLSSPTGFRTIPRWTIPSGLPGAGIYGSRDATLQALIDEANTEITQIAHDYPLQASQSVTSYNNMARQLKREKETWAKVGINPESTLAGTEQPIFQFISNIHDYGTDTALGGKAWIFEKMAVPTTRGGQAIIGAMREGRNIQRLADAGIPTSLFRDQRDTTEEQATLLDSTYTVEEAKNSIKE